MEAVASEIVTVTEIETEIEVIILGTLISRKDLTQGLDTRSN